MSLPEGLAARDAVSALTNLGYAHGEAAAAISAAIGKAGRDARPEELIRLGLEGACAMSERMLQAVRREEDQGETSLRPQTLVRVHRPGQGLLQSQSVHRRGARRGARRWTMCCSQDPPGLGKTTLAQIVARELGVNFRATSGPVIAKAGDLAALLTNLEDRDVLFIDEIHRLNPAVEEILYPAIEDFQLDLIIGEGPAARSVRIDLSRFTLIGATTRTGLLTTPLRERFGIPIRLEFYGVDELEEIVRRGARLLGSPAHERRRA